MSRRFVRLTPTAFLGAIVSTSLLAAEPAVEDKPLTTETTLEVGQVVKGEAYSGGPIDHLWTSRLGAWLTKETIVDKRLELKTTAGLLLWSPVPNNGSSFWPSKEPYWSPSLGEARATYRFGDVDNPWMSITAGYFPFKYNPESRNLGEYMYRTMAHPPIIMNTSWIIVNRAEAFLTGLRVNQKFGPFSHDLLLTTETEWDPLWDFSLGYLFDVHMLKNFLDVGAGANLWRYFSADNQKTTPKTANNQYVNGSDTSHYSYKAIKLVGRLTLDPKVFIPVTIFGKEDLKIYGEAAILDVNGQGPLYDTLKQRIVVMLGCNVPAFKVLDVLSFEIESFNSPYANDMNDMIRNMIPVPMTLGGDPRDDDIKWSVFAEKRVLNAVALRLQIARDHLRLIDYNEKRPFYLENIRTKAEWYWMFQATFGL